jgi:hypothetical protein
MLLMLCVQMARDAWDRRLALLKVYDIAVVFDRVSDVDLVLVTRRAKELACYGLVQFSLTLANEVFPLPTLAVPEVLRPGAAIRTRVAEARVDIVDDRPPRVTLQRARYHRDLRERARDWVCPYLVWFVTPTIEDRQSTTLPDRLALLLYVIRPARLAVSYASSELGHNRRRWIRLVERARQRLRSGLGAPLGPR